VSVFCVFLVVLSPLSSLQFGHYCILDIESMHRHPGGIRTPLSFRDLEDKLLDSPFAHGLIGHLPLRVPLDVLALSCTVGLVRTPLGLAFGLLLRLSARQRKDRLDGGS